MIEFDKKKLRDWTSKRISLKDIKVLFEDDTIKYALNNRDYRFIYEMASDKFIPSNTLTAVLLLAGIDDLLENMGKVIVDKMFLALPITDIRIPNSIKDIGIKSFGNNNLLKEVYLPKLRFVSQLAFDGSDNIEYVYIDESIDDRPKLAWETVFPNLMVIHFKDGDLEINED